MQENAFKRIWTFAVTNVPIVALLLFTSIATWDIVGAVSPPDDASKTIRQITAVLIADLGFLYWEYRARKVLTEEQRTTALGMQVVAWLYILTALISDGLYRQNFIDMQFPTWAAYAAIYAPLLTAAIFLAGHAVILWFDPTTQTEILTNKATQELTKAQHGAYENNMRRLAPQLGQALAMDEVEERFRLRTGKEISEVLDDWQTVASGNAQPIHDAALTTESPAPILAGTNGHRPKAIPTV